MSIAAARSAPSRPAVNGAVLGTSASALEVATSTASSSDARTPPAASYKIGDSAKTSSYQVTVYAVKDPATSTNQFDVPQAGDRYVRLQIKEVNSADVIVCVAAFGDEGEHKPNNVYNGTSVATQNVVS